MDTKKKKRKNQNRSNRKGNGQTSRREIFSQAVKYLAIIPGSAMEPNPGCSEHTAMYLPSSYALPGRALVPVQAGDWDRQIFDQL